MPLRGLIDERVCIGAEKDVMLLMLPQNLMKRSYNGIGIFQADNRTKASLHMLGQKPGHMVGPYSLVFLECYARITAVLKSNDFGQLGRIVLYLSQVHQDN